MKKFALMAAVAAASLMTAPAAAHADWYAGAGYTHYDVENSDGVGGVTGRLGYRVNPNFAIEGEGTLGVNEGDNAELNSALGIYAVGSVPIGTSGFDVHGRVGYNQIDLERDTAPDIDDGGVSYGAGLGWTVNERVGLRADFTRTETDDADADAISLGGTMNF